MKKTLKSPLTPEDKNQLKEARAGQIVVIVFLAAATLGALAFTLWLDLFFFLTLGGLAAGFGGLLIQGSMQRRASLRRDLDGGEKWICHGFIEEKSKGGSHITVDGCDFMILRRRGFEARGGRLRARELRA
ncbi:MAG: hypothetical protein ACOX6T_06225 [Myxococcales bacterium]|jgi:hypothetical protein